MQAVLLFDFFATTIKVSVHLKFKSDRFIRVYLCSCFLGLISAKEWRSLTVNLIRNAQLVLAALSVSFL